MNRTRLLPWSILLPLLLVAAPSTAGPDKMEADRLRLRQGVRRIAKPGVPGPIALVGDDAFAVVAAPTSKSLRQAVVAAARVGRGRVVAFGHDGYLGRGGLAQHDTATLVGNALRWAGGDARRLRIGTVDHGALESAVDGDDLRWRSLPKGRWAQALDEVDVLVLDDPTLGGEENAKALSAFVRRGGGLVTAGLAWGWMQLNPGRSLRSDHRLNALLGEWGLYFADGMVDGLPPLPEVPNAAVLDACHAARALEHLSKARREPLPAEHGSQVAGVVASAFRWAPESADDFRRRVRKIVGRGRGPRVPTRAEPIRAGDARDRLALLVAHVDFLETAPARVSAAESAADFPGAVPRGARRVTEMCTIDLGIPGWASTGLYAAAGDAVAVKAHGVPQGTWLRIGCHSDRLWTKDEWRRHPEITHRVPLGEGRTTIASPHGGLLYIEIPGRGRRAGSSAAPGSLEVEIRGAVPAPRFVLGETDTAVWRRTLRRHPAPWAELAGRRIVLSVPSALVRDLDDPEALMQFWDDALALYAELGQRPLPARPERMVPDRQISAGWLHSGYPIMAQELHGPEMLDLARLRDVPRTKTGAWGFWHELGHNHQRREWTFSGSVEVTCNFFSLYVEEKVRGVKPSEHPWAAKHREKVKAYVGGDRDFDRWKRDPGLALWTFLLLQDAFGWEAFQEVFASYTSEDAGPMPRDDAAKRDQWLVRFSRTVGRDLGPYFEAWGIPTSAEARAQVADLPEWMPDW